MSAIPEPVAPNSIRAELDADGQLILSCGEEAFTRLRDLLAAEASDTNTLPADPNEIESVLVVPAESSPVPEAPQSGPVPYDSTWRETVAILGCLGTVVALIVVFFI